MDRREAIKKTAYLLGTTISATTISSLLNGCQPTGQIDWEPKTLSLTEANLTGEIAERILPASNTPGAKDLFVPEFIDLMLTDCYDQKTIDQFKVGLKEIDRTALGTHGKSFMDCKSSQQDGILRQFEVSIKPYLAEPLPKKLTKPFFLMFKELTLLGYFTSEYVMKELINFNPVPGAYQGCIDIDKDTLVSVDLNV